jgi:hypothetical protein
MLKPLEAIDVLSIKMGWSQEDSERKKDKLLSILTNPMNASPVGVGVFAHGPEAIRVSSVMSEQEQSICYDVQTWSPDQESWVSQKRHTLRSEAVSDAKNWYPTPKHEDVLERWPDVIAAHNVAQLRECFHSREKLAEFYYDTMVCEVPVEYGKNPLDHASTLAWTILACDSRASESLPNALRERINDEVAFIREGWGELMSNKGKLSRWKDARPNEPLYSPIDTKTLPFTKNDFMTMVKGNESITAFQLFEACDGRHPNKIINEISAKKELSNEVNTDFTSSNYNIIYFEGDKPTKIISDISDPADVFDIAWGYIDDYEGERVRIVEKNNPQHIEFENKDKNEQEAKAKFDTWLESEKRNEVAGFSI